MPLDPMPKTVAVPSGWSAEMQTEYKRRRRGRNLLLLAALAGFCVIIYAIAIVKLHEYGQMW
jgi:hypothetical protein